MEEEFAKYLSQKAFDRFVYQWKQKYIQLGHLGGSISIDDLSSIEIEQIGSLLGKDLSDGQLSISYKQFIKHLHNDTKYENIDFLKVLNIINGKRIKTNKERK